MQRDLVLLPERLVVTRTGDGSMRDMVFALYGRFNGGHRLTSQAFGQVRPMPEQGNSNLVAHTSADYKNG